MNFIKVNNKKNRQKTTKLNINCKKKLKINRMSQKNNKFN